MKRYLFAAAFLITSILFLTACDQNPFAAKPEKTGPIEAVKDVSQDAIVPDQVKLPDETATGEALIPQATTVETAAVAKVSVTPATEETVTQTVTFDPNDSTTAKLAKCLTQKGVRMYGAYWCPHCQDQKAMFGDDFKFVKYFECDPKGPESDAAQCLLDKIDGYPTWYFPSSGYNPGVKELEKIASLSGCEGAMQ